MPYKDPEVRKQYLKGYYKKNSDVIKETSKKTQMRNLESNPDFWAEHHEKYKDGQYLRRYGLTFDQYNQMFAEQEGRCKICKTHQSDLKKRLNVDHCHTTKRVRGLLCIHCNTGLGMFRDNREFLADAIEYLKESIDE